MVICLIKIQQLKIEKDISTEFSLFVCLFVLPISCMLLFLYNIFICMSLRSVANFLSQRGLIEMGNIVSSRYFESGSTM